MRVVAAAEPADGIHHQLASGRSSAVVELVAEEGAHPGVGAGPQLGRGARHVAAGEQHEHPRGHAHGRVDVVRHHQRRHAAGAG